MKLLSILLFFLASTGEVKVRAEPIRDLLCSDSVLKSQKLVSGCIWVRSNRNEKIQSLHANAESLQSQFFIKYVGDKIVYVNHSGVLKLTLRDGRQINVPAGFSVWVSEVQMDRKNKIGILQPVDLKDHLVDLASIWQGSPDSLKSELKPLVERWGNTHELAAQFYKGLATRRIASIEEAQEMKKSKKLKEIEIRKRNQKLLFERAFNR